MKHLKNRHERCLGKTIRNGRWRSPRLAARRRGRTLASDALGSRRRQQHSRSSSSWTSNGLSRSTYARSSEDQTEPGRVGRQSSHTGDSGPHTTDDHHRTVVFQGTFFVFVR